MPFYEVVVEFVLEKKVVKQIIPDIYIPNIDFNYTFKRLFLQFLNLKKCHQRLAAYSFKVFLYHVSSQMGLV